MIFVYIVLYLKTLSFAVIGSTFNRKLRRALIGRWNLSRRLLTIQTSKPLYWFQVASSGEFEQSLPIMEELKKRKDVFILLTYFSPSGEKALKLETERRKRLLLSLPFDSADYSPWDLPWIISPIVHHLKPMAYVAIHREIWPVVLKTLKAQGTKTFLLSTFWPLRSQRRLCFLKRWLRLFDFIGTVNDSSTLFLRNALAKDNPPVESNIQMIGDSRVDRILTRKQNMAVLEDTLMKESNPWRTFFPGNNFIGASLWSEDFKALKGCIKTNNSWRFVLVPHDPATKVSKEIFDYFKAQSLPIRYWSSWIEGPDTTSHLIVNRVGFLAELYKVASIVFVGGSFKGRIHNVLEPAAYGCPIITGSHIWNSNEALEIAKSGKGLTVCQDQQSLTKAFQILTNNEAGRKENGLSNLHYIETHEGAGSRYAELLTSTF